MFPIPHLQHLYATIIPNNRTEPTHQESANELGLKGLSNQSQSCFLSHNAGWGCLNTLPNFDRYMYFYGN